MKKRESDKLTFDLQEALQKSYPNAYITGYQGQETFIEPVGCIQRVFKYQGHEFIAFYDAINNSLTITKL